MSFSEKLQALRKANKMSQEKLADLLDVTRQSVSKWESGQTYPEMDKLLAMCKIFKCSLDDLTNDEVTDIKVGEKKNIYIIIQNCSNMM
jgi:transcriptional regulator